jgi:hypothetical protein
MRGTKIYLTPIACLAMATAGCGVSKEIPKEPPPEPWSSAPQLQWPQIVLTNHAEFNGHTPLQGASSFLMETNDGRVFAATARHLIGSAGGVQPDIRPQALNTAVRRWRMFPRTLEAEYVEVDQAIAGLEGEDLDWLVFTLKASSGELPATPLKLRAAPVAIGEQVYLLGCPYEEANCKQNVYEGTVTGRGQPDRFRFNLQRPVDIRGFSGAPIVDRHGHLVGVMTVWFDPRMSGDLFVEAGGEDVSGIYSALENP